MKSEDIFALGLGLLPPWQVKAVDLKLCKEARNFI